MKSPSKILLFINLPQDLDLLLPIIERIEQTASGCLEVAVSNKAWKQSPRIGNLLAAAGIKQPAILSHKAVVAGLRPSLRNKQALITASESTAIAHKGPHKLARRANQKGIATYTLQHGFDNVGLTYFDAEHPVGKIMFASQTLFTWGKVSQLPAETPTETKLKCVAVGCPKFIDAPYVKIAKPQQIPGHKAENALLVVFENLHWSRYSQDYRQRFLQDLAQTAIAHPHHTVLVKPHHTGQWLTQQSQSILPAADNLIIADPKDPQWETFTAPALIRIADAVITTPSTVAIDAARARCPVAVVACDLALLRYEPLPLLRHRQDWQTFLSASKAQTLKAAERFLGEQLIPGDAVGRIINHVMVNL